MVWRLKQHLTELHYLLLFHEASQALGSCETPGDSLDCINKAELNSIKLCQLATVLLLHRGLDLLDFHSVSIFLLFLLYHFILCVPLQSSAQTRLYIHTQTLTHPCLTCSRLSAPGGLIKETEDNEDLTSQRFKHQYSSEHVEVQSFFSFFYAVKQLHHREVGVRLNVFLPCWWTGMWSRPCSWK